MARIGLVLGGGAASGAGFHAGALAALAAATGWDPRRSEVIVGTSAGAIAGAMLGVGLPAEDFVARMQARPLSPEGTRLLGDNAMLQPPAMPRPSLGDLVRQAASLRHLRRWARLPFAVDPRSFLSLALPRGTVGTEMISGMVSMLAGERWPPRALHLCAVRLGDGERTVFGRPGSPETDLGVAVAASCAIPGVFRPVRIDDHEYVDGGIHSPTNADVLLGHGLDLVIVSAPMSSAGRWLRPSIDAPMRALSKATLAREVRLLRADGAEVFVLQPTPADQAVMGLNLMDGTKRGRIAGHVRTSMLRYLEQPETRRRLAVLTEEG